MPPTLRAVKAPRLKPNSQILSPGRQCSASHL
jgi:hypothetical protein